MAALKTYRVVAEREGNAWTATVVNADGAHTWGKGLRHLEHAVREAIALAEDIEDETSFALEWEYHTGATALDAQSASVRDQRDNVALAAADLRAGTRTLVTALRHVRAGGRAVLVLNCTVGREW